MIIPADLARLPTNTGFLVLEGLNGAGKTTLQSAIANFLIDKNSKVIKTFEPGATELGKSLRKILLEPRADKICHLSEVLLFAADRAEHVTKVIKPALKEGNFVVSDRYIYSSIAFQGYGREFGAKLVSDVNSVAVDNILPDLVILLDIDPIEGLKRTQKRGSESSVDKSSDAFEQEKIDFHHRIRNGFLEVAKNSDTPFIVIDASKGQAEIFAQIKPILETWYNQVKAK